MAEFSQEERRDLLNGKAIKRNGTCSANYNLIGCIAPVEQGVTRLICFD